MGKWRIYDKLKIFPSICSRLIYFLEISPKISAAGNYVPQVERNHQFLVQIVQLQRSRKKNILVDFLSALKKHIKPGWKNSVRLLFFRLKPSLLTIYIVIRSYNTYKGTNRFIRKRNRIRSFQLVSLIR